jgi:hypothetical protein
VSLNGTPKTPGLQLSYERHSLLLSHVCPSWLIFSMQVSFAFVTLLANSVPMFHNVQNDS